ncbi:MAG: hypothetical protein JO333_08400 [Verrucomicrobia bacterium]|nr:hypothetical protein [Verrucomicrobiota bacterium]
MKFQVLSLFSAFVLAACVLVSEGYLLWQARNAIAALAQGNDQQKAANDQLAKQIEGLQLSKSRIDALFLRLSDSVIAPRGVSSLHVGQSSSSNLEGSAIEPTGIGAFTQAGFVVQPLRVPNGEMSVICEAGTANLEFHRLVPLLAEQENADLFLYFDKVVLSRPASVRPFSNDPTYLDTRLTIRLLTSK